MEKIKKMKREKKQIDFFIVSNRYSSVRPSILNGDK